MALNEPASAGHRLYLVRLALGDGVRKPESMKAFAERVERTTGVHYDPATISLLETGGQKWKLEDARTLAAVDPMGRGAVWLSALGLQADEGFDPEKDRKLTVEEEERAVRRAATASRERLDAVAGRKRRRKR